MNKVIRNITTDLMTTTYGSFNTTLLNSVKYNVTCGLSN